MSDFRLLVAEDHRFRDWEAAADRPGRLPYGMEALEALGVEMGRVGSRSPLAKPLGLLERAAGLPVLEPVQLARAAGSFDALLTIFEDRAVGLGLLKRVRQLDVPLVVMTCWLAQRAMSFAPWQLKRYRPLRSADLVITFSPNQADILVNRLGLDASRIHSIDFGVNRDFYQSTRPTLGDYVFAAGGDIGRDYATLARAAAQTELPVKLVAQPWNLKGVELPPNVEFLGTVPHPIYRRLMAQARCVVVPTHPFAYPTGQSVLLEAMMTGKAVITTDTPAMRGYVPDGTGVLVRPGDPYALAHAMRFVASDDELALALAARGRALAELRYDDRLMWRQVNDLLRTRL